MTAFFVTFIYSRYRPYLRLLDGATSSSVGAKKVADTGGLAPGMAIFSMVPELVLSDQT